MSLCSFPFIIFGSGVAKECDIEVKHPSAIPSTDCTQHIAKNSNIDSSTATGPAAQ